MKQNLPKIQEQRISKLGNSSSPLLGYIGLPSTLLAPKVCQIHLSSPCTLGTTSSSRGLVSVLQGGSWSQIAEGKWKKSEDIICDQRIRCDQRLWSELKLLLGNDRAFLWGQKSEYISLICFVDASKAGRVCFPEWISLSVSLFMSTSHTRVCIGRFVCVHMVSHWSWGVRVLLFRRGTLEILHRARDRTLGHGLGS